MPISFPSYPKSNGGTDFVSTGSGEFWVGRAVGPIRIHPLSLPPFSCCTQAQVLASPTAKLRLGQFPGDSNGPTVLSSYDCIVLLRWNDGVLPRSRKEVARTFQW